MGTTEAPAAHVGLRDLKGTVPIQADQGGPGEEGEAAGTLNVRSWVVAHPPATQPGAKRLVERKNNLQVKAQNTGLHCDQWCRGGVGRGASGAQGAAGPAVNGVQGSDLSAPLRVGRGKGWMQKPLGGF